MVFLTESKSLFSVHTLVVPRRGVSKRNKDSMSLFSPWIATDLPQPGEPWKQPLDTCSLLHVSVFSPKFWQQPMSVDQPHQQEDNQPSRTIPRPTTAARKATPTICCLAISAELLTSLCLLAVPLFSSLEMLFSSPFVPVWALSCVLILCKMLLRVQFCVFGSPW